MTARHPAWKWAVCVLLLLATMLNYMDRLTVAQLSKEIIAEFQLTETDYGSIDAVFSVAFALGALLFGFMADKWNVWWIYPTAVAAWSAAGALTGTVPPKGFAALLMCRFFLGLTESGHWPCALKTTQRILPPEQRTLGNSILQSGAAVGAVLTPLVVLYLMNLTNSWRVPFILIGSLGMLWVAAWYVVVKPSDLAPTAAKSAWQQPHESFFGTVLSDRRFWILVIVVICINSTWHFFRVWLPRLLQKTHGYPDADMNFFTAAYYLSTDIGSLAAGFGTVWLVRRGFSVHGSRLGVFAVGAFLTTLSIVVIFLPRGPLLLAMLLVIGFGALSLFPPYYSFTQELSVRHQGKVTGLLGCLCWLAMAPLRVLEGYFGDQAGNFHFGLALAGTTPVLGLFVLLWFWPKKGASKTLTGLETSSTPTAAHEAPSGGSTALSGRRSPHHDNTKE
jgi:ACS family hexuronate transporter-like MFS transporter